MSGDIALGAGAEFDVVRLLLERWGARAIGIGDDAAVFQPARGEQLVTSIDAAVEGRHFARDWLSPREIGYRATAAALSDLAAMAARPAGILVALVISDEWRDSIAEIADGIGEAVESVKTVVRGGNISAGGELSITTTVFGHAFAPLMRNGARAGQRVYVTGRLGGPLSALARIASGESAGRFRERLAHPVPRLAEARWLSSYGATSAIDISDGLFADARHIAAASNVRIEIDAARVPCVDGAVAEIALVSGEEYELVVTAAELDARAFESRFSLPLTEIGRVVDGASGVDVRGARVEKLSGHDHLSR